MLLLFVDLPRLFGASSDIGECRPSSSVSLIVGAILSIRLLAALNLLRLFASASFSLRFLSLLFAFRSSFSNKSAHQPARESHRCASTFSITMSISHPAARIRCNTSFSSSVENGAGCCNLRISCCLGACSDNHGFCKISARLGLNIGRFDSNAWHNSFACGGKLSGNFGSSFRILVFVTVSSSSSKGNSPTRSAYKMIPKLQTSTFSPAYFSPLSISGAL